MRSFSLAAFLCFLSVSAVSAQSQLEVPGSGSKQSGIGIVSGWKCTAGTVTVQFDNGPTYQAGYGTIRTDTQGVCGDTNNGWSFLWNWNKLGDGNHTVQVFDNGVQFGAATFMVQTLGAEFRTDLSKTITIADFPAQGQTATLQWQQEQQNFVITGVTAGGVTGGNHELSSLLGTWEYIYTITSTYHDHFHLTTLGTFTSGTPYLRGIDTDDGKPVVLGRFADISSTVVPYVFFMIDPDLLTCDLFAFDLTGPNSVQGIQITTLASTTEVCNFDFAGNAHVMVGTRTSTALLTEPGTEPKDKETETLGEEKPIVPLDELREFLKGL